MAVTRTQSAFIYSMFYLMQDKDYESITVSELCEHAGYNRGTFYKNFTDKDGLLNKVTTQKLESMSSVLINLTKLFMPEVEKSLKRKILIELFDVIDESRYFFRTVLKENKIKGFRYEMFKTIKSHLIELPEKFHLIEEDSDVNFFLSMYYTSGIFGIICNWIQEYEEYDKEFVAEQLCEILEQDINAILKKIKPLKYHLVVSKEESDLRIKRSKKAFSEALILLLNQKKIDDISISEIAEQAKYNRSTFYTHFSSKQELYEYLIDDFVRGIFLSIHEIPDYKTYNPIVAIFDFAYERRALLEAVYRKNKIPGFFNQIYSRIKIGLIEQLEGRIHINSHLCAEYIVSTILTFIGSWISMRPKYSSDYISNIFFAVSELQIKPQKLVNEY